jgi:hypothetical protein
MAANGWAVIGHLWLNATLFAGQYCSFAEIFRDGSSRRADFQKSPEYHD